MRYSPPAKNTVRRLQHTVTIRTARHKQLIQIIRAMTSNLMLAPRQVMNNENLVAGETVVINRQPGYTPTSQGFPTT